MKRYRIEQHTNTLVVFDTIKMRTVCYIVGNLVWEAEQTRREAQLVCDALNEKDRNEN